MLMLDNNGSLNSINDLGQTPLAFASRNTLKRLDLENAIATTTSSLVQNFDNNKCLLSKKSADNFSINEFCNFRLEKMVDPTDKVCVVDDKQSRHLISFPEKLKEKQPEVLFNSEEEVQESTIQIQKDQIPHNSSFKNKRVII